MTGPKIIRSRSVRADKRQMGRLHLTAAVEAARLRVLNGIILIIIGINCAQSRGAGRLVGVAARRTNARQREGRAPDAYNSYFVANDQPAA